MPDCVPSKPYLAFNQALLGMQLRLDSNASKVYVGKWVTMNPGPGDKKEDNQR